MCCNITHNFSFRISLVCGFKYCRHLDILYPLNYKIDEQKIIFSLLGKRFFPTPRFYFFKQTIKSPSSQIWLEEGGQTDLARGGGRKWRQPPQAAVPSPLSQIWPKKESDSGGNHCRRRRRQRSAPLPSSLPPRFDRRREGGSGRRSMATRFPTPLLPSLSFSLFHPKP